MAVVYDKQYNPISINEYSTGDALSIRTLRDTANNINNYKACVGNHPLVSEIYAYDDLRAPTSYSNYSIGGAAGGIDDYRMINCRFAKRYLPHGYTNFVVQGTGYIPTGRAGTARWWVYMLSTPYVLKTASPLVFDRTGYEYAVATFDLDGGSSASQLFLASSTTITFSGRDIWIVLCSNHEPDDADEPISVLTSLTVRPMVSERI